MTTSHYLPLRDLATVSSGHTFRGQVEHAPPGLVHVVQMAQTTQSVLSAAVGDLPTIELEGRFIRGRGSVDEYLEQTAIANPHVTLHYKDPEGNESSYHRSTTHLPPEPKEIKPHPYGIELGRLVTMLKDTHAGTMSAFLTENRPPKPQHSSCSWTLACSTFS